MRELRRSIIDGLGHKGLVSPVSHVEAFVVIFHGSLGFPQESTGGYTYYLSPIPHDCLPFIASRLSQFSPSLPSLLSADGNRF